MINICKNATVWKNILTVQRIRYFGCQTNIYYLYPHLKSYNMKTILISLILSPLLFFCFFQCKKQDTPQNTPLTIILHDKPLSVIQSYIQGKWRLHYGKGGICGTCVQYYNNVFWKFTNDRIEETYNGRSLADTTIKWIRDLGTYTNGDSTFIMNFYDKRGYPSNYVVDHIFNDTLVLHDNSSDAVFYHFSKSN